MMRLEPLSTAARALAAHVSDRLDAVAKLGRVAALGLFVTGCTGCTGCDSSFIGSTEPTPYEAEAAGFGPGPGAGAGAWVEPEPRRTQNRSPAPREDWDFPTHSIPDQRRSGPPIRAVSTSAPQTFLQYGAFQNPRYADRLVRRLQSEGLTGGGYGQAFTREIIVDGRRFTRVRVGPVQDPSLADQAVRDAQSLGYRPARVTIR